MFRSSLRADETGFEAAVSGTPSIQGRAVVLVGRYQTYVRAGSQYATWRQFPQAIRIRILAGPRGPQQLPSHLLSISDHHETYDAYAAMPCEQIVGKDFTLDLYPIYEAQLREPGRYELDAEWMGLRSNPVAFELAP